MQAQQLELTKLLVNGRTKFEPDGGGYDFIEVLDDATLSDLHRWLGEERMIWEQRDIDIKIFDPINLLISYNSSLDLLEQTPETLTQIIELVKKYS